MKISVFSLFRDNGEQLKQCLSTLEEIEKETEAEFNYFFYENDSTDNTPAILKEWFKDKEGTLHSDAPGAPKYGSTLDPQRMIHMATIRNNMLSLDTARDSDYAIIFDSDVVFDKNIVNDFLSYTDLEFSMLTPNVRQDVPCKMGSGCTTSYYDSSILFDRSGLNCMTWSDNPFYEEEDREAFTNMEPIEVNRAFGSFAFFKSEFLFQCQWQSRGESEHWSLCDQLRKKGKIYFLPSVKVYVSISQKHWDHEDKVVESQLKLLENPWNRFLYKAGALDLNSVP